MTANGGKNIHQYQGVAPARIIRALEKASAKTGVDFSFLMQKASTESSFNASAKAKTSSATGLFQFIENTWLGMVKEHGDKYGLGAYADKISFDKNGRACVADCDVKQQILNLRQNPEISALMAGEFSAENKTYLEKNVKGEVGNTELYLAHFLGAGSAAKFLNAKAADPQAKAAQIFPEAARANKNVFFDKATGRAKTLEQIYASFDKKFTGKTTPSSDSVAPPRGADDVALAQAPAAFSPASIPLGPETGAKAADISQRRLAQELPSSIDILWDDTARPARTAGFAKVALGTGFQKLPHASMLTLLEMQAEATPESRRYNS